MNELLNLSEEVREALERRAPVVALESTLIAHGMPWPRNAETANALEAVVREEGAVPATVAIIDGRIQVGLEDEARDRIANEGPRVIKCSRRDLPVVLADKALGATTVCGTLIACMLAGIPLFATGGIGGVHRGASESFDISADLPELARSPVAVVCAGAKSVLDIGATLEYLETLGVPVLGFGSDEFPAFYTRRSGFVVDQRIDSPEAFADIFGAQRKLGFPQGVIVANPIAEEDEAGFQQIQEATDRALAEAEEAGLRGKAVTPFLLSRIEALTGGASLDANVKLVIQNARLAARLASAWSRY